jgi:hypothetical protein
MEKRDALLGKLQKLFEVFLTRNPKQPVCTDVLRSGLEARSSDAALYAAVIWGDKSRFPFREERLVRQTVQAVCSRECPLTGMGVLMRATRNLGSLAPEYKELSTY